MEGLREGRKEREREQRVPKESRRQRGEKERWRAQEEETFPVELMLWGHFLFFNRNGVLFEIDFFCFIILIWGVIKHQNLGRKNW